MKLVYSSSLDDLIAFDQWLIPTQRGYAKRFWFSRISETLRFILPFLIADLFIKDVRYVISVSVAGLIVGVYIFITYPRRLKASREKCIRNLYVGDQGQGSIFGRHAVEITDNSFTEKTELGETTQKFSAIIGIEEIQGYIFIMLGPSLGWVIPRNKIEEGDLDQFTAELRNHLQKVPQP